MKHLNIKQIEEILPHRHPFLLVDYIEDYEPGKFAVGYKCVTFRVEALAQTGAVAILSKPENKGKIAYFGGIDKCRFKGKVQPGDKLKLEMKIIKEKGPMGVGEAIASVDGKLVVKAELTFMVG